MKNIFKNASFGKAYKIRDGRKAIYHKSEAHGSEIWHYLIVEPRETTFMDKPFIYAPYGKYVNKDGLGYPENLKAYNLEDVSSPNYYNVIVSEWQPIDEEKLDELAKKYASNYWYINEAGYHKFGHKRTIEAFKAGYRKALEYLTNNEK